MSEKWCDELHDELVQQNKDRKYVDKLQSRIKELESQLAETKKEIARLEIDNYGLKAAKDSQYRLLIGNLKESDGRYKDVCADNDKKQQVICQLKYEVDGMTDENKLLRNELEQAKKDQARYLCLKSNLGFNGNNDSDIGKFEVSIKTKRNEAWCLYDEKLDQAIDAAMQENQQ